MITQWLLIVLSFTGPTSADKIDWAGPYDSETKCELAFKEKYKYESHICIPIGFKEK